VRFGDTLYSLSVFDLDAGPVTITRLAGNGAPVSTADLSPFLSIFLRVLAFFPAHPRVSIVLLTLGHPRLS
jgi:hypothetical protein